MSIFRNRLPVLVAIAFSIMFAVAIYALILLILGALDRSDIKLLPGGKKFIKMLEKLKVIK